MSYVEIQEFNGTNIYDYNSYPNLGIFKLPNDQYAIVYISGSIRTGVIVSVPGGFKEIESIEKPEQDLATILSVALHKEAAIEFIRSSSNDRR